MVIYMKLRSNFREETWCKNFKSAKNIKNNKAFGLTEKKNEEMNAKAIRINSKINWTDKNFICKQTIITTS